MNVRNWTVNFSADTEEGRTSGLHVAFGGRRADVLLGFGGDLPPKVFVPRPVLPEELRTMMIK